MHQRRFEPSQKSTKKNIAIKFFEDLFALEYLQNYIGYITFFARFPSIMETCPVGDVPSVGAAEEDGSTSGRQLAVAETDTRLEAVLPLLHKRCQTLCESDDAQRRCADERQRVEDEIKCISHTLGADLLKHIRIAFYNAYREHESPSDATHRVSPVKYDRQLDIPSMVQDIKELQVTLNATKDRDELRALEEDVTGKILWLFWCGICAEVDELLPTVVEFIRREANMKVSGVTRPNVILIAVSRVYRKSVGFTTYQTQVMIKRSCNGSCMMREQRPQNICCGLPLGLRSKRSGRVQIGAPLL
ncbi:hypothetical protein PISMIDRAFT_436164 [Pisolithus microcarpus 441]|uniref:Uncharacterized protein n=1 Tax=Pisolithus microcarpus 441 TaxID=765257 RepID=A0A0C9ZVM9_9AGAM|nr:hypothetical protein BKA83DRAFT_436164 [Pisolithus microcarpus]KIK23728.1 hypothetical protein PISMIDRAFT_436164 [Pisolithus microcarpus 441]